MEYSTTSSKYCHKCNTTKPATTEFFTRNKSRRDGLSDWCKSCSKEYRAATKTQQAERNKAYYAANKERELERNRKYASANRARLAARARARYPSYKERLAKYRSEHRAAFSAYQKRRMEKRRNAPGNHTEMDIQRQLEAQKGKCYYCGREFGDKFHVDHVVPLSRGGSDGPENIVVACSSCNLSKKDKLPHEWPRGNRLL